MARRRRKGLGRSSHNPAAAVGHCKRMGVRSSTELYHCAMGLMPVSAPDSWSRVAKRLASEQGLGRSRRRRRR